MRDLAQVPVRRVDFAMRLGSISARRGQASCSDRLTAGVGHTDMTRWASDQVTDHERHLRGVRRFRDDH